MSGRREQVRLKAVIDINILIRRLSKIILNINYFSAALKSDSHASTGRITESTHRMSTRSRKSYHAQSSHEEQHLSRSRLHKQHEDQSSTSNSSSLYSSLHAIFSTVCSLFCKIYFILSECVLILTCHC